MPLEMRHTAGQGWAPAFCCDVCKEPVTPDAPGQFGCLENRDGNPTPHTVAFVHDGECRQRYDWHGPVYTFHGRPLQELACLL